MKAILINAKEKTITEVQVDENNLLQSIYDHMKVSMIEQAHVSDLKINGLLHVEDIMYVDEEGLINETDYGFTVPYRGGTYDFMGNGLIVGLKYDTGDTTDCLSSVEDIEKLVIKFNTY
jgi:hypothetical protein